MKSLHRSALATLCFCVVGCSGANQAPRPQAVNVDQPVAQAPMAVEGKVAGQKGLAMGEKEGAVARKIKYTADVKLICEDFDKAHEGLLAAVKQHQGLVAHSEITGSPGTVRSGHWRLRVPVAHFEPFRAAVLKLGDVEKDTSDSEDVTEEYYDLEAHIKNKQAEEESLRKLLEKSGDKMENILAVRRELAQVRDEVNRLQGRLKLLANLTDLTTVNVTIREKQRFDAERPPDLAEVPSFGMRAGRTFTRSTEALTAFVEGVLLIAVALAPWAPLGLALAVPAVLVYRRIARARRASAPGPRPDAA